MIYGMEDGVIATSMCALLCDIFRTPNGNVAKPSSLIIVHVGDLLVASTDSDLDLFRTVMAQFRTGQITTLTKESPFEYLCLLIRVDLNSRFGIHQTPYCQGQAVIKACDVVRNGKFAISTERWRTLRRMLVGSLIWTHKTRFGDCADATFLSASEVSCLRDDGRTLCFLKLRNCAARELHRAPSIILYNRASLSGIPTTDSFLLQLTLFE